MFWVGIVVLLAVVVAVVVICETPRHWDWYYTA